MSKRLIVNSQLEFVAMLHYAQSVPTYAPWEQESRIIPILAWERVRYLLGIIEYGLPILHDLLFAREYTSKHFDRVVLPLQLEPPYVLLLRATHYLVLFRPSFCLFEIAPDFACHGTYLLMVFPTSLISKYYAISVPLALDIFSLLIF